MTAGDKLREYAKAQKAYEDGIFQQARRAEMATAFKSNFGYAPDPGEDDTLTCDGITFRAVLHSYSTDFGPGHYWEWQVYRECPKCGKGWWGWKIRDRTELLSVLDSGFPFHFCRGKK